MNSCLNLTVYSTALVEYWIHYTMQSEYKIQTNLLPCPSRVTCIVFVLYLSISIALLTAWAFQKRSRPQQLTLCRSLHAETLQATPSEGLAQGPYVADRVGSEPVDTQRIRTRPTTLAPYARIFGSRQQMQRSDLSRPIQVYEEGHSIAIGRSDGAWYQDEHVYLLGMANDERWCRGSNAMRSCSNAYKSNLCVCVFHSFIPAISIAPLQVLCYWEALPTTVRILYRSFTPRRTGNCR